MEKEDLQTTIMRERLERGVRMVKEEAEMNCPSFVSIHLNSSSSTILT